MTESEFSGLPPVDPGAESQDAQALVNALRDIVVRQERQRIDALEAGLQDLNAEIEPDSLAEKLNPVMSGLVRQTIHDSPDEMAEAIGPVMGEAIRVQIRDSRQGMVDAIAPIIGATIQKALSDFSHELQRNIDARLRTSFRPSDVLRSAQARLRGISSAELAMRDALPFAIQELFLIHRESGLLLAHLHPGKDQTSDSDLIGGMLTAIRDFVQDSFGQGQAGNELDEIQYGEQRIIIQSGHSVYLAAVIAGVESPGFRSRLREWVNDLYVQYGGVLRDYTGDPAALPNLEARLAELIHLAELPHPASADRLPGAPRSLTPNQRLAIVLGALGGLLGLLLCCFYIWFTFTLLPVAWSQGRATLTQTFTLVPSATQLPTATWTHTPTVMPSPSLTPLPSATPTPLPTVTFTSSPSPLPPSTTPAPVTVSAIALGNVWLRAAPDEMAQTLGTIPQGSPVYVRSAYGNWLEVDWNNGGSYLRGWAAAEWFFMLVPLPSDYITPTAVP